MERRPAPSQTARSVLDIARTDRKAAIAVLGELSVEDRVALLCEAPLGQRARLLDLEPDPEALVPLIPEAELCFTAKAIGTDDAGWLLALATPHQITACFDLDGWNGITPDLAAVSRWFATLAEAGEKPLLQAAQTIDPEMLVLYLRDHVWVELKPAGDEDWMPPEGGQTLEGQFYFVARREGDDLAPLLAMLHVLFREDYWLYFRMLQGVIWELESGLEEWVLRWRTGRLEELGFPSWDEAMRIYGFLRPGDRARLPEGEDALDVRAWSLPVWISGLPAAEDSQYTIFRALRELDEAERTAFFYAFIAIANKVAVADRLPLGDAETLPIAIEKAAEMTSAGLEHIATERGSSLADVLRRATLERLFRVGASLDPSKRPTPQFASDPHAEEDEPHEHGS